MKSKMLISAAITIAAMVATPALAHTPHAPVVLVAASADQSKVAATKAALRDLWIGHVFWVRNVVVAGLAGDAVAQKTAEEQAVANAQSIAAAIEPFYGAEGKDALFALLAGHYGAVKAYLDASIAKDADKQAAATKQLLDNAGEIAGFLSGANPNLPRETVEGLLQAHGGHHLTQIQQLQAKDYAGEAGTWAEMTKHMYVIADALAEAMAKQFPASF
jgi:hypothetical protein